MEILRRASSPSGLQRCNLTLQGSWPVGVLLLLLSLPLVGLAVDPRATAAIHRANYRPPPLEP